MGKTKNSAYVAFINEISIDSSEIDSNFLIIWKDEKHYLRHLNRLRQQFTIEYMNKNLFESPF
ncbi:hypothetical protein LEP1GSC103_3160 [Leptospira borgpetersenii serovar Javanica str. UI 09931]|uniref:Uncharacterized protein n=3 Tax=Leptospira borgpetersenii TaxID=174 RepID=M3GSX9_LEPBO|nr:hypothetical protein LEP1GSC128_2922 [Leptospira borgpetersenii str. 200801926]EMF97943.1 hypothetical protein LEP1GSC123_4229 [Leptospira borgpetersenii str. 200701203]EMN15005.1 hypothetical protein LEP1GSC055_2620 [Leptospira borgpetersenii str. Brem 307]ENO63553.1 hypothetical protein LEP1GSC191_2012 [Leptospira borgpetersenii serovar Mini str. 201000851]EPG58403.1 hypothetical protein LEP1GSC103_3160 [Leptospira borgpetersenii serovar Javanica str. UI 09931]